MMMMITLEPVCYLKETGKAINSSRHKKKYYSRFVGERMRKQKLLSVYTSQSLDCSTNRLHLKGRRADQGDGEVGVSSSPHCPFFIPWQPQLTKGRNFIG